jgi:hypothetical protein
MDCKFKGKLDRGQIEYVAWCILQGAFDSIECSCSPTDIKPQDRVNQMGVFIGTVSNEILCRLSAFEYGVIDSAGWALSIFYAQYVGEGMGVGDALDAAGGFHTLMEKFVQECWKDRGEAILRAHRCMGGKSYQSSEIYPFYPDIEECARAFANVVMEDYKNWNNGEKMKNHQLIRSLQKCNQMADVVCVLGTVSLPIDIVDTEGKLVRINLEHGDMRELLMCLADVLGYRVVKYVGQD